MALVGKGDRKRLKRAVYLKASGMLKRAVRDKPGLNYQQAMAGAVRRLFRFLSKNIAISKIKGLIKRETIVRFWIEFEIGMSDPVRSSVCTPKKILVWRRLFLLRYFLPLIFFIAKLWNFPSHYPAECHSCLENENTYCSYNDAFYLCSL